MRKRFLRGDCGKAKVGLFSMELKYGWFTHEIAQTLLVYLESILPLIFAKGTPVLLGGSNVLC